LLDPPLGRIAGDQCRVDRADRNSGDPIGVQTGLGQGLIGTALVGAEGTTALQQQGDPLERRPFGRHMALLYRARLSRHCSIVSRFRPRRPPMSQSRTARATLKA
jgi:hypothetical protein